MNTGLVIIATVMALLCIRSDAKREEKNDITKEAVKAAGTKVQAVNSGTFGKPATGSGSIDEANNKNYISNSSASNNINHDENNESYGNSSNPSGSTVDSRTPC